jgi:hypothetical protein
MRPRIALFSIRIAGRSPYPYRAARRLVSVHYHAISRHLSNRRSSRALGGSSTRWLAGIMIETGGRELVDDVATVLSHTYPDCPTSGTLRATSKR